MLKTRYLSDVTPNDALKDRKIAFISGYGIGIPQHDSVIR